MSRKLALRVTLPDGHYLLRKTPARMSKLEVLDGETKEVVGEIPASDLKLLFPLDGAITAQIRTPFVEIVDPAPGRPAEPKEDSDAGT